MKKAIAASLALFLMSTASAEAQSGDSFDYRRGNEPAQAGQRSDYPGYRRYESGGWRPIYLLSGPAAIFKGVGASLWCMGNMGVKLFSNSDTAGEAFTASILAPPAMIADGVVSMLAYAGVGIAHSATFGFLVDEPPRQIEDIPAPIYCLLSDEG